MGNDEPLRALAARQYAMFSRHQAADAGVSWEAVRSRLRAGSITQVNARVLRLAGAPAHRLEPLMATALDAGPGTFANRRSAAHLWGCRGSRRSRLR